MLYVHMVCNITKYRQILKNLTVLRPRVYLETTKYRKHEFLMGSYGCVYVYVDPVDPLQHRNRVVSISRSMLRHGCT